MVLGLRVKSYSWYLKRRDKEEQTFVVWVTAYGAVDHKARSEVRRWMGGHVRAPSPNRDPLGL